MDTLKELKRRSGISMDKDKVQESINNKVIIRRSIDPPVLTADDWELYMSKEGAEEAAVALNNALAEAVNAGMSGEEVESAMHGLMSRLSKFGAMDTEPRYVLTTLLRRIFGKDYGDI